MHLLESWNICFAQVNWKGKSIIYSMQLGGVVFMAVWWKINNKLELAVQAIAIFLLIEMGCFHSTRLTGSPDCLGLYLLLLVSDMLIPKALVKDLVHKKGLIVIEV